MMQAARRWWWVAAAGFLLLATSATAGAARGGAGSGPQLPPGLAQALTGGVQGNLPVPYRPQPGPGGFQAENPAHRLEISFTAAGPEVRDVEEDWKWRMTLIRYGRDGALKQAPGALVVLDNDRVEYRRGPTLTEWYLNTALGLEQGFTFTQGPPNTGFHPSPLVLEVRLSGTVRPVLEKDDRSSGTETELLLQDVAGRTHARYTGLCTYDADGKVLPSRLALAGETLRILVDDREARYPIVIDPWLQKAKLTSTDGAAGDSFGFAVAIDGDTAVVGGRFAGAAWVFERNGYRWTQVAKLVPHGLTGGFGSAVAVSGDTVVVGQPDVNMAHVFVRPLTGWQDMTQTAILTPDDGDDKGLGWSVGISGDTVAAGAPHDDVAGNNNQGSAYVFVRPAGGWADMTQTAKLTAGDGEEGDEFGCSAAISGDTIVVGAFMADVDLYGVTDAGGAYVFVEPPVLGWVDMTQTARLRPYAIGAYAQFGNAVAISGDTVVVGAWLSDYPSAAINSGSAHVFTKPALGWFDVGFEDAVLAHGNADAFDAFGKSVAVNGDTVVVGADEGLAYVFEKAAGGWGNVLGVVNHMTETAELVGIGREADDSFGSAVAVRGDIALVGARGDDVGDNANQGSVYVFSTAGMTPPALQFLLLIDD